MGIVGIHPAVFRKSAEGLDCKRVVNPFGAKSEKSELRAEECSYSKK